ncbi:MAG: arylamine N-acetyltransferase [Thermoleophilaceae bacterium]
MTRSSGLAPGLAERVLERLGYAAPPPTDLGGLGGLYLAWCRNVPWDNLQKRITVEGGRAPLAGAEPAEFFANFLAHGTGGTCWPSSGALHDLLAAAGFPVRRAVGAMHHLRFGRRANHGTVIATVEGAEYLVDSSMLTEHVLPLRREEPTAIAHAVHPIRAEPTAERLWSVWWSAADRDEEIPCLIFEDDVGHERYLERYEASRADGFSYAFVVRKNLGGGVVTVTRAVRYFKDARGAISASDVSGRLAEVLVDEIGFSDEIVAALPPDVPDPRARAAAPAD